MASSGPLLRPCSEYPFVHTLRSPYIVALFTKRRMDSVYHVVKIDEEKGLGCVALNDIKKGTLILQEKPQCFQSANDLSDEGLIKVKGLIKAYNGMNKDDQEEYLKLHNKFKNLDFLCNEDRKHLKDQRKYLQEFLFMSPDQIDWFQKIYGIYNSNAFEMGLGLKSSRFNHSCVSNAEAYWNEKCELREIRAISKIKAGEEITVRYGSSHIIMKNLKTRQEYLSMGWKFNCDCPLCEEEAENCEDEKYEKFELLKQEAEALYEQSNIFQSIGNMRREVQCYKEMYKLAKEKQATRIFILSDILKEGFNAAVQGYLQVTFSWLRQLRPTIHYSST